MSFIPETQGWFNIQKNQSVWLTYANSHEYISVNSEEAFDKI